MRARHLRRLLCDARRRGRAGLPDVRGAGAWPSHHNGRGAGKSGRLDERAAGQLLRGARLAVRLLHARDADRGAGIARLEPGSERSRDPRRHWRKPLPLHRLSADGGSSATRRVAKKMTAYRYIGAKRRAKEHPRFVTGRGRYVADVAVPGMKHVALVASPHASARIVSINVEAAAS